MIASLAPARKVVNRAWHAFFYAFGAVAAPYLVTEDRLEEIAVSRQLTGHVYTMAPNGSKFDPIRYLKISEDSRSSWRALLTLSHITPCSIVSSYFFHFLRIPGGILQSRLEAATASALPTPGGGPHAAIASVHGTALLEMCFYPDLWWSMLIYTGCCSGFGVWWPVIHDAEVIWIHHSNP